MESDQNPFPKFDLLPRLTRIANFLFDHSHRDPHPFDAELYDACPDFVDVVDELAEPA